MQNETITTETAIEAARTYKARPETEISTKIGIGVARSYDNPAIAASRKVRRGCTVYNATAGETAKDARYYESVCKAFNGEGINLNGHIPFRGSLRKEPKGTLPYIVRGADGKEAARFIFTDTERVTAAAAAEPAKAATATATATEPAKGKGRKK